MKKSILLLFTGLIILSISAQNYQFPEIVQEKLDKENLDITLDQDYTEVELSEENYYEYVYRDGGTDTILGYKWHHINQEWVLRARIIKHYNANEQVTEKFFQHLSPDNNWINGLHFLYVYDGNGNRVEKTIQFWHRFCQQWVNHHHRMNVFNAADQLTEVTTQRWAADSMQWVNRHHRLFVYDNDLLVVDTVQTWRFFAGLWGNKHLNYYHYDSLDRLHARITHHWRPFVNHWVKEHRGLFKYYPDGDLKGVLKQVWNPITQYWKDISRNHFQYDDYGNRISNLKQIWKPFSYTWEGVELRLFTYDDDFLIEAVFKAKRPWQLTWHNKKKCVFDYDDDGNMIEKLVQHWSGYFQEWYNFRLWQMVLEGKSSYAGILNNQDNNNVELSFKNPYTSGSTIYLSGLTEGLYQVNVYNMSGQIVFTGSYASGDNFSLDAKLPEGLYLLNVARNGNVLKREKIVITE